MAERRKVLVVDDDDLVGWLLADALAGDFTVIAATSGEEALLTAGAELPDAILLDVEMPGIGGLETGRRLKADPATAPIPVIFVSGHGGGDMRRACLAAGGADYLAKPFKPADVIDVVMRTLRP